MTAFTFATEPVVATLQPIRVSESTTAAESPADS